MIQAKNTNNSQSKEINNPFNETNFKIQKVGDFDFVVRSDSEKFGCNEIVFQGITYNECLGYIADRVENITPSYYVIKDLASWRSDVWKSGKQPERSSVERFDTVEAAISKFLEYKAMDYLKEELINPDDDKPMRRLALGVSYSPYQMAEMDLLHTEGDETLLISDVVGEKENGYERFMTNSKFIKDLNTIMSAIHIDEYSYYRDMTIEELAKERLHFLKKNYPEELHTEHEAMQVAREFIRRNPNYLRNHRVEERIAFHVFIPPYLNMWEEIRKRSDCSELTLHIKYPDPPLFVDLGYNAEYDSITFGNIEELLKYINGKAAYDILDDSVLKHENEILLYAENNKGDVVWGTKEESKIEKENTLFSDERLDERGRMDAQLSNTIRRRGR